MIMIAILLAIVTLWVAGSTMLEAFKERRATPGWRRADGVVMSTRVHEEPRQGERGFYLGLDAEIRYSYEVDGVRYESVHQLTDDGQRGGKKISRAMVRFFPPGARIRLHFEPGHPDNAKLLPRDLDIGSQIGCIVVLLALTIGSYIAAWM